GDLLYAAIDSVDGRQRVAALARSVLSDATLAEQQRSLWLCAAYLSAPEEFEGALEMHAAAHPGVVWHLRSLSGYERSSRMNAGIRPLIGQLEFIIRTVASRFRNTAPPGSWAGDENPWDASEFVRSLINRLSSEQTMAATEALARLAANSAMASYSDH